MKKKVNAHCPYCKAKALLRSAEVVYGPGKGAGKFLFVCANYPACDAYVGVHKDSLRPMGSLANPKLREMRISAHKEFSKMWENRAMTKKEAYRWLQMTFGIPEDMAHIAQFSEYRCDELIGACQTFLAPRAA